MKVLIFHTCLHQFVFIFLATSKTSLSLELIETETVLKNLKIIAESNFKRLIRQFEIIHIQMDL